MDMEGWGGIYVIYVFLQNPFWQHFRVYIITMKEKKDINKIHISILIAKTYIPYDVNEG